MAETKDDTAALTSSVRLSGSETDALASRIEDKFEKVFSTDDGEDPVVPEDKSEPASDPAPADKSTPPARKLVRDHVSKTETKDDSTPEATADDALTLPAAYVRSLKANDWSDDEIKATFKAQGSKFLDFASKVHQTRNVEIARLAELGRSRFSDANPTPASTTPAPASGKPQALKAADIKALKEKYADDPLLEEVFGPINAVIERVNAMLPTVEATQARARQAETEALGRQVESFFTSPDLKGFEEVYGGGTPNDEQLTAKTKVIQLADQIVGGAVLQGRTLSVEQALLMAHDSLSAKYQKQTARESIRKELTKRQAGITLKPSGRGAGAGPGRAKSRDELESNVKLRLAKAFTS